MAVLRVLGLLACVSTACTPPRSPVSPTDERDVVAQSRRQFEVIQHGDRAAADALLAPEFHYFSWRALPGRDRDQAHELAEYFSARIERFDIHDMRTAPTVGGSWSRAPNT